MGRLTKAAAFLAKRGLLYATVKVLLSLLLLADAVLIQVSPVATHQSLTGGALNITSQLTGADKGFSKAASTLPALGTGNCTTSVPFAAVARTANTAITAGDIVYDIQLNTTTGTPPSTCFTVTLVITPNGGSPTTYQVFISTVAVPQPNQTIDCKFDIGTSLPTSPSSFRVTVG